MLASDARLSSLVAPAGYGKSHVIRALASEGDAGICDCEDVAGVADLARRIVAALGSFSAERDAWIARQFASLPPAAEYDFAWAAVLAEVWAGPGGRTLICFENADALGERPGVFAVVARLLRDVAAGRRVVVASRRPLALVTASRIAPHELAIVGAEDLRFDSAETRRLFASSALDGAAIERIVELGKGWPIASLSAHEWAHADSLDAALAGARTDSLEALRSYLETQFVASLDAEHALVLAAAARLGSTTCGEIDVLFGTRAARARALLRATPFVLHDGERIDVHVLARDAFSAAATVDGLLEAHARRLAERGATVRAAHVFLLAGRHDDAAAVLERAFTADAPRVASADLSGTASEIDPAVLVRHPATWYATIGHRRVRMSPAQLLAEAEAVWSAASSGPAAVRCAAGSVLAQARSECGRVDEAVALLDVLAAEAGASASDARRVLFARSIVLAHAGRRITDGTRERLAPLLDAEPGRRAAYESDVEALTAIYRGERDTARRLFDSASSGGLRAGARFRQTVALADAAFFAWLAAEDELYTSYLERLRPGLGARAALPNRYFLACVDGTEDADPQDATFASIATGRLIAALGATSAETRVRCAELALSAALSSARPMLVTFAWIGIAIVQPARRDEAWTAAQAAARRVEDPRFSAGIAALANGERVDWLKRFADRLCDRRHTLRFDFGSRRIPVGDRDVVLAPREALILTILATCRTFVDRARFAELISPDADPDDALNSLRVNVSRLRKKLEPFEAIVSERDGYRIGGDIVLDVDACAAILERVERTGAAPTAQDRRMLAQLAVREDDTWPTWIYHSHVLLPAIARAERTIERAREIVAARNDSVSAMP
jgi:DNA-binding winged helix-turn-helix (wHTH) protein